MTYQKPVHLLIVILALSVFLSSCGTPETSLITPVATTALTNTPVPTYTLAPTNTPKPTNTLKPTDTPTQTPTPTEEPTETPTPTKEPTKPPTPRPALSSDMVGLLVMVADVSYKEGD